jgi:hypothetical protein
LRHEIVAVALCSLLSRKTKMMTYRLECCCAVVAILNLAARLAARAAAGAGDVRVIWRLIAGRHCGIKCVEVLE